MISVLLWAKLELLVQFSAYFHMYEWSWKHYFKPNFKVRIMASDKKANRTQMFSATSVDVLLHQTATENDRFSGKTKTFI